ncbi:ABC transporter permease [Nakamurella silvestris]|nr:ABC transporter permease [Nakamurella silvestris]
MTPPAPTTRSGRTGLWSRLWSHGAGRTGLLIAGAVLLVLLVGPFLTTDPDIPNYTGKLLPPSGEHWLGTDLAGRDLLARTLSGGRTSLGAALLVCAITTTLGLLVGTISALVGGIVDTVLCRIVDILLGLPSLVLTLAVVGALGPGFGNLVLAMSVSGWAGLARLARSVALSAVSRPDVTAARMAGAGPVRVTVGHVLPAVTAQVLVAATMDIGSVVLALGGLSFLGLGAQPPTAEWGNMLSDSRLTLTTAPWQVLGPGLGLIACISAAVLISDALRDITDPAAAR